MPELSRHQFGNLAHHLREGGGFTIHAQSGEEPKSGWMVGRHLTEYEHPGNEPPGASHIAQYTRHHAETLRHPDHYLGGWGQYLDTPKRHEEEGPNKVGHAYVDMVAQRQKAMFGIAEANNRPGAPGHMTSHEREVFKPAGGEVTNPAQGYHDEPFHSYARRVAGLNTRWKP